MGNRLIRIILAIFAFAIIGIAAIVLFVPDSMVGIPELPGKYGMIYWYGNSATSEVALTFDDGPDKRTTPVILDILKKYNIKATFFVVGKNIRQNSELIKRIDANGHVIGNHTYYHLDGRNVNIDRIRSNLKWTDSLIKKFTGKSPEYFRPPFGYENWRFLREAERLHYKTILWSVDGGEWNSTPSNEALVSRIVDNTVNGSIILLHDGGEGNGKVRAMLPVIIEKLTQKGFRFVTITELLEGSN